MSRHDFQRLAAIGISGFPQQWVTPEVKQRIAMDAALVTTPNNGVPAWMTQYTSPKIIEVLTAKRAAEEIYNPVRFGSYGTTVAQFPVVEHTGNVDEYTDNNTGGSSDFNANWPTRQAYYFQTVVTWGDLETAVMAMGKIDAASKKQASAALTLKIAHNNIWFNGVAGLANYGILNDPSLNAPSTPTPGTGGLTWALKTTNEIYNDFIKAFTILNAQLGGIITQEDTLEVTVSNNVSPALSKATEFNVSVKSMLKEGFPNLTIKTAPQMATQAGELMQMVAPNVEGQTTGELGYVELMKAHGVVRELSSLKEKYSAANFGSVLYNGACVSSIIGI